jgi:hypothetical protein
MQTPTALIAASFKLANHWVTSTIQCECVRVTDAEHGHAGTWWDTRPMLDPREHAPQVVDMATEALQYALDTGLAIRHPRAPHLVRLPIDQEGITP